MTSTNLGGEMRVQRTVNAELIKEVLSDQRLWSASTEDGTVPVEEFWPDCEAKVWLALIDSNDQIRGFLVGDVVSKAQVRVHIAIRSEYWGDKENVALGKLGLEWYQEQGAKKIIATIPTEDTQVLRFAQRCGLKREGINKQSFLRNGEMLDQYYLGLVAN